MPKLLIIIARLNKGGTSAYIRNLVNNLPSDYEISILTGYVQGKEIEDESISELPIIRAPHLGRKIDLINDLIARKEIYREIQNMSPDIIYTHTFKAGLLTRTLRVKIPIIHAFHGHLLNEPELTGIKVKIAILIERALANRAKFLITVGQRVGEELRQEGIGEVEQYVSIPPGVEALILENKSAARRILNIQDEVRPVVVWMARVVAVKGPNRVIEIAKSIPEARFLLAGGGELMGVIQDQAPDNLTVLGWQPASLMWSVADLAISTSFNEGMPISLIEAQLAGIPVVALDVGSISEVVHDKETGFIFPIFDSSYTTALRQLVHDSNLRNEMGTLSKVYAKKYFSCSQLVDKHLELFKKII